MPERPRLFVKTWCPWCIDAQEWLDGRAVAYELVDVEADRANYDQMIAFSGQRCTPTLLLPTGVFLADFGPDELPAFLTTHGILPG